MTAKYEIRKNFALKDSSSLGYWKNPFYIYLLRCVPYYGRIPAVGLVHPGIEIALSSMRGLSDPSRSLALECAETQQGNLGSYGYAYDPTYYLQHELALCADYFLRSAVCFVVKPSGVVEYQTRNRYFLDLGKIECPPEEFLTQDISFQIETGNLRGIKIDPATGHYTPGSVTADDTVLPVFLVRKYIKLLLDRLQKQRAMLSYEEYPGKIGTFPVTLCNLILRGRCFLPAESFIRAASDGESPEVSLPVVSNLEPDCLMLKIFKIFSIRNVEWMPNL